jgi:hypothetical protein
MTALLAPDRLAEPQQYRMAKPTNGECDDD